jgi:hypothetical protein
MPKVSSGLAGNSVVGDRLDLAGADPATPVLDCYVERSDGARDHDSV